MKAQVKTFLHSHPKISLGFSLTLIFLLVFTASYPVSSAYAFGCTYSHGYWKNHSDPSKQYDQTWDILGGPDALFFNSEQGWSQVLHEPATGGNAYYILARQYIAAKLNYYNGASATVVQTSLAYAEWLFNQPVFAGCSGKNCLINVRTNSQYRTLALQHAEILEQFNNGGIGPGQCDE
jgi:hypothetical protein